MTTASTYGIRRDLVAQLFGIAAVAALACSAAIALMGLRADRAERDRLDHLSDRAVEQVSASFQAHRAALLDAAALPSVIDRPSAALVALGSNWGDEHLPAFGSPPRWVEDTALSATADAVTIVAGDSDADGGSALVLAARSSATDGRAGWIVAPFEPDQLAVGFEPDIDVAVAIVGAAPVGTLAADPDHRPERGHTTRLELAGTMVDVTVATTREHRPVEPLVPSRTVAWVGLVSALLVALVLVGRRVTQERLAHTSFALAAARTLAETDALTGLLNRDGLERRVAALTSDTGSGVGATVFFADLDNFKRVNDEFGHDAGDRILREVAVRMRDTVRTGDAIARLGGDEFVVVCPGMMSTQDADRLAQRLLSSLRQPPLAHTRGGAVGASIGYAVRQPDDATTVATLVSLADAAMYEAKRCGGDQTCVAITE
ncbi:MAG: GGDEF domain-containing protein [Acidimicrobiales bacterium]|nr:GGDEF domain-containing protein [Acidimicrobiales bacterium]